MNTSPTTPSASTSGPRRRAAAVISEVLAPWVLAAVLPVVVGGVSDAKAWRGLGLGALLAVFSAAIPSYLVARAIRAGRVADREVRRRQDRPRILAATAVSVLVGLGLAWRLGAPHELFDLVAAMVAGMVVSAAISLFWKISLHVGVVAGSVAVLAVVLGPWAWLLLVAVMAVAWSRLELSAHTPAQVAGGAVIGAAIAGGVMGAL